MTSSTYTPEEKNAFKAFVRVQRSGRHNLTTQSAQQATGLSREMYRFVLKNYTQLDNALNPKQRI